MSPMDPKIEPLVNALNATKLVRTFSSCEGHYTRPDNLEDYTDYSTAHVLFEKAENVDESELERMFLHIHKFYNKEDMHWTCILKTHKRYWCPPMEEELTFDYAVVLTPFNPYDSDIKKRKDLDKAIDTVTRAVDSYKKSI